jgi:vacuolar-type H+-ATPase subunit H
MRDAIQRVIASEAAAKEMVAAARKEAECVVSDARCQAQAALERARQETRAEAERILAAAVRQAGQDKQLRLDQARHEYEREVQLDPDVREALVAEVIRVVCGAARSGEEAT